MPVIISGSTGISGTDGSAGTPAVQGTDGNTGMFFPAADTIAFAEGGVEAMRLDANGNVGIGTTTPSGRLDVSSTAQYAGITLSGSGRVWQVGSNSTAVVTMNFQHDALAFASYGAERARITSTGDFQFNSGYGSVATAYACRAWVNFNGTGTVAIRASGNVSSIGDLGTGNYTVNFTNAMPDTNYVVVGTVGTLSRVFAQSGTLSTTVAQVQATLSSSTANEDQATMFASFFR